MQAVSPVIEGLEKHEVVVAKHQPEYDPLPTLRSSNGIMLSRWELNEQERAAVAAGADVFLYVWTDGPMQPVSVHVGDKRDVTNVAAMLGLRV